MKTAFIFLSFVICAPCFAKLEAGFDKTEARDMIAICNSFTFLDLYDSDSLILPKGYEKTYTSGVFGMDNKYQIYQKGDDLAVINLRGSTDKQISWLENIYSAMIPANGVMKILGYKFNYCFALDTNAAVHSGYALGIGYLRKELLYQIKMLNKAGIYDFIITGHSQGGALANMLKAYLENLPATEISKKNKFKVYAFAAPMTGNKAFATEYNNRYGENNTSFNIVNPEDLIPTFPASYNDTNFVEDNLNTLLNDKESFSIKRVFAEGGFRLFQNNISQLVRMVGRSATKRIAKELGPVEMPDYVKDINYRAVSKRMEITPFEYPRILKDSTILKNDSLMAFYQHGSDGSLLDEKLYKKPSWTYQHKPYNYYVSVLKMYFPEEYDALDRKYLPENL